jgi:dihydrodipicolinate synthase/N-acetylneuraminate lyase
VQTLRRLLPSTVKIGISGDASAATGLNAGCDLWYSAIGGILPVPAVAITRAALSGDADSASAQSARLQPLWRLFVEYGSYRVTAAIGEHLGLLAPDSLPRPVRGLDAGARAQVARIIDELQLSD